MGAMTSVQAAEGIKSLVEVSNLKSQQANDEALKGADKQRGLVAEQKQLRANQSGLDNQAKQGILIGLRPAKELPGRMSRLGAVLKEMDSAHKRSPNDPAVRAKGAQARAQLAELIGLTDRLKAGFANAEKQSPGKGGQSSVDELRKKFDSMMKDLEAKDRMGNFEIQRLMSAFNQAETLSSNVQKKADDTVSGQQQKI